MRLPLVPLAILLLIDAGIDVYIWRALRRLCKGVLWPRVQLITGGIFALLLIAVVILPYRAGNNDVLLTVMWMLFTYLSVYLGKIVFIVFDFASRLPQIFHRKPWKALSVAGIVLGCTVFLAMWWGALFNRFSIQTERIEIAGTDVPRGLDGFTIAQISDLHVGTFGNDTTFVCKLVGELNSLKPDMIVFTGDIVNRRTEELCPFVNALSRVHAPYGVYSVMGNHDYGDYSAWPTPEAKENNVRLLKDMQRKMGWHMLNNDCHPVVVGADTLFLVGVENVGDPPFHTYGSLAEAYPGVSDSRFKILLSHNPAHWDKEIQNNDSVNIALTLSGHTHAMQIELLGQSPARWRYRHWGGMYTDSLNHRLYVNIGAGTVGFPARIGATPEITLFTLHHSR